MSLLVLLSLSLTTLTHIEVQSSTVTKSQAKARQNALYGLHVALGQLQALAGPDQRVTARADLQGSVANPYFVGVWDSTSLTLDPTSPMAWLVSGKVGAVPINPTTILSNPDSNNSTVWMVNPDSTTTTDVSVKVISEPISNSSGNYAYWVADESLKANVSLTDPFESPSIELMDLIGVDEDGIEQYRYLSTNRFGIEGVRDGGAVQVGDAYPASVPDFKSSLANLESMSDFPLAALSQQSRDVLIATQREREHDLTIYSRGLLTDAANGGLKKDLSVWLDNPGVGPSDSDYIASNDNYMPRWGAIRDYHSIVNDGTPLAPIAASRADSDAAAENAGLHPVMTYAQFGVAVSHSGGDSPVNFHFFPIVVLWNPYNVPIAAHDYEMWFDFSDVPTGNRSHIFLKKTDNTTMAKAFLTVPEVVGGGDALSGGFKGFRFDLQSPVIPPGQSLVYTLDALVPTEPYVEGQNVLSANAVPGLSSSVIIQGPSLSSADLNDSYKLTKNSGTLGISLRDSADTDIVYHQVQSHGHDGNNIWYGPVKNFKIPDSGLVFSPQIFFRVSKVFSQTEFGLYGREPRSMAYHNALATDVVHLSPDIGIEYFFDYGFTSSQQPNFGNGNRASAGTSIDAPTPMETNDFIVFSFRPEDTPLFSLAQLQHANLSLSNYNPVYAVGNSVASPYIPRDETSVLLTDIKSNMQVEYAPFDSLETIHDLSHELNTELWDTYFFSTIPSSINNVQLESPEYQLPNSRYKITTDNGITIDANRLRATDYDKAASMLYIDGVFNINSTSVDAWRALLHSRIDIAASSDDEERKHSFPHYPDVDTVLDSDSTWEGNRTLTDAQINHLAEAIVAEVRLRGPFRSMADFINRRLVDDSTGLKGTLQAAIDRVDSDASIPTEERINIHVDLVSTANQININEYYKTPFVITAHWLGSDENPNDIVDKPFASQAAFSPGYLSQADLLTTLGPLLTVRSDTFLIRAYGNVINEFTGELDAETWCEAVVQRVPDYCDDTLASWQTPLPGSENETFGRRFVVTSFRWLSDDEI